MNIYDKLEQIRSKPEHIRMRYVWLAVFIFMVFVLIIWIFSIKSEQVSQPLIPTEVTNSDVVNQFNEQKDSLQGAVRKFTERGNQPK